MAEQQANLTPQQPGGAVGDEAVVQQIDQWLQQDAAPQDEPAPEEVNARANPEPPEEAATEAEDEPSESAREAEAAESEPEGEETKADAEPQESEEVEIPDTVEGLAEKWGVDPNDLRDHIKVTVKVDGQTKTVSLGEAAAGFQLESKYRQNTQALAEEKKAFANERESFQNQQQQGLQLLQHLMSQAEQVILGEERAIDPSLQETDPERYMLMKEQARDRRDQYNALYGSFSHIQQQHQGTIQQQQAQFIEAQANKLAEMVPEWGADPAKGKAEIASLRDWATAEYGFEPHEVANMMDARTIKAFRDLKQLKDLEGKVPTIRKKLKALPKTVKPTASKGAEQHRTDKVTASLKRFRKSRKDADGVELLLNAGLVD